MEIDLESIVKNAITESLLNAFKNTESPPLTYTFSQTMDILNCGKTQLQYYIELGLLPGIKQGKGWIFSKKEIENFLEKFKGCDLSTYSLCVEEKKKRTSRVRKKGVDAI